jgi:hypothetical protein
VCCASGSQADRGRIARSRAKTIHHNEIQSSRCDPIEGALDFLSMNRRDVEWDMLPLYLQ